MNNSFATRNPNPTGTLSGQRAPSAPFAGQKLGGGYKQGQLQQFTPEQMDLFKSLFSQVSPDSYTSRLANGDEGLFNEMEEPALRQFSGLQGNIASRFSGMGSGARRSSGFQNTINSASSDFASNLQSQRQGLQRQAIQDLLGMSRSLLSERPYENFAIAPQQKRSFFEKVFGGSGAALGQGIGNKLAGLFG